MSKRLLPVTIGTIAAIGTVGYGILTIMQATFSARAVEMDSYAHVVVIEPGDSGMKAYEERMGGLEEREEERRRGGEEIQKEEAEKLPQLVFTDDGLLPAEEAQIIKSNLASDNHFSGNDGAILQVVQDSGATEEHQIVFDKVLKWLPSLCRDNLKYLIVRYDEDADRGLATMSTIMLNGTLDIDQLIGVLIHECWHVIDLGGLKGTKAAGKSLYPDGNHPAYKDDPSVEYYALSWRTSKEKRSNTTNSDFASGYARTDPWEDLAELGTALILDRDAAYELAEYSDDLRAKITWMETYVLPADFEYPQSSDKGARYVWDWTKQAHNVRDLLEL